MSGWMNITNLNDDSQSPQVYQIVLGCTSFILTLPFVVFHISRYPLGSTGAALAGAFLMVVCTVIDSGRVYTIIGNVNNLRLTFLRWGMMIISAYVEREQWIDGLMERCFPSQLSFRQWLMRVSLMSSLLAALFTNDVTCILLTPILLKKWIEQRRDQRELNTLLLSIPTMANIGSALTIFGNPQMALIASRSNAFPDRRNRLDLKTCVIYLWFPILIIWSLNLLFLFLHHRLAQRARQSIDSEPLSSLTDGSMSRPNVHFTPQESLITDVQNVNTSYRLRPSKSLLFKIILFLDISSIIVLLFASNDRVQFDIGLIPVGAAIILFVADTFINHQSPSVILERIDWNILLLFFGMFVWLDGLNSTGVPTRVWQALNLDKASFQDMSSLMMLFVFILIGSNIFSNVPLTILILDRIEPVGDHLNILLYLAFLATIAGNLTLFGSVANLIVAQKALNSSLRYKFDFWTYFKYGFFTTLILSLIGLFIIYGFLGLIHQS